MQEQPRKRGGILRLVASLLLLVAAVALFLNRQLVVDQLTVWRYQPSAEIQTLARNVAMTPQGEFYFYASQPEINNRESFNRNCTSAGEQTVVLGCYAAQRIYIFDVDDLRLNGIEEVTAAHEMLHAAYERLSSAEKNRINGLLETQLKQVTDTRVLDLIAVYDRTVPGQRMNEIHSIFASELRTLTPDLEVYYSRYFSDRAKIASLSQQYEGVFSSIKQQQEALVAELNALAETITTDTEAYNTATAQLSRDIDTFNNRANNGGFASQAAFNAERNTLVSRQSQLASLRSAISSKIEEYNNKLKQLEELNGQAEQLNRSINSNALEPAPSL